MQSSSPSSRRFSTCEPFLCNREILANRICRIGHVLQRENIRFVRLDGSLSQKQRERVLAEFNNPKRSCVLLLSMKAGGTGLNLVVANTVLLCDGKCSQLLATAIRS